MCKLMGGKRDSGRGRGRDEEMVLLDPKDSCTATHSYTRGEKQRVEGGGWRGWGADGPCKLQVQAGGAAAPGRSSCTVAVLCPHLLHLRHQHQHQKQEPADEGGKGGAVVANGGRGQDSARPGAPPLDASPCSPLDFDWCRAPDLAHLRISSSPHLGRMGARSQWSPFRRLGIRIVVGAVWGDSASEGGGRG